MRHEEVQELLGAYALDALETDEADAVDLHLRDCPRCRAEVEDFRETAGLLAFGGVEAPPGVWEKIQASMEEAPPRLELARVVPIKESRWRSMGARVAAVAAVIISVIALGVSVLRDDATVPANGIDSEIAAAAVDPDAKLVNLVADEGSSSANVVILGDRAYLARDTLPPLDDDHTYQLWGRQGDTTVSLGVLGSDPSRLALPVGADYEALAITAERKPGVVSTTNPVVVAGSVPAA